MIKTIVFPGNSSFEVEVNTEQLGYTDALIDRILICDQGLFIFKKNPYGETLVDIDHGNLILGWRRRAFPACCGLDIVYELYTGMYKWKEDVREKWWKWMEAQTIRPAIGIIPKQQKMDGTICDKSMYGFYDWFMERGTPMGEPFKNTSYPDHVLIPYMFFPKKDISQITSPKYGPFIKSQ